MTLCCPPSGAAGGTPMCARRTGSTRTRRPAHRRLPRGRGAVRHGCRVDTPAVRGAWTVLAHQAARAILSRLAAGRTSAPRPRAAPRVRRGTQRSARGARGAGWMLRGRLFQQALTEAIWAVTIGHAARSASATCRSSPPGWQRPRGAARGKLLAEGNFTSNYVAWLDAAGAACSGKPGWLDGQHGLYNHLLAATYADGWEWEASTYYHSFVLRAYRHAIAAVPDVTVPATVRGRIDAMADVLRVIVTPGGLLPSLHDGPYRRVEWDRELAELAVHPPLLQGRRAATAATRRA